MRWSACVLQQVEEYLSDIPLKTTACISQWAEQLTCIHEVAGSNLASEQFFVFENHTFCIQVFLKFSFDSTVTWHSKPHSKHTWKQDLSEIKCSSSGNSNNWLLIDICFSLFFTVHWRHWCRQKTGNSCGKFLSKPCRQTLVNQLSCALLSQNFFSFWTFLKQFFLYCDCSFNWYLGHCLAQLSLVGHCLYYISIGMQNGCMLFMMASFYLCQIELTIT